MIKSNLKISDKCIQCGSCLACGMPFLSSSPDGMIVVQEGTILEKDGREFQALKEACPVDAFELDDSISAADKKKILGDLILELKNYTGIPTPTEKNFKFTSTEYYIPLPVASGEYRYEYSSSSAAERAALREFERAMYSQIDNIILKIITEYRVKYVKAYYTADISEGSVYAKSNRKVTELLEAIKNMYEGQLPNDFSKVDVMPDEDITWKMLNKGELISDELVSAVKSEFDYPSSQYDCYWTWDDMEKSCGTDWRGNLKYKDMYCYKDMRKAFEELSKDLLNACRYAHDQIEGSAVRNTEWLVKVYNEKLKQLIEKKLNLIV